MFCIVVSCYIDRPEHEMFIVRCIDSIRRIYPEKKIYISHTKTDYKPELAFVDPNIFVYENPYPGTTMFGAIYLFMKEQFAESAFFMHDTMALKENIDDRVVGQAFKFSWYFKHSNFYDIFQDKYRFVLGQCHKEHLLEEFIHTFGTGWVSCFGISFYATQEALLKIDAFSNLLDLVPEITNFQLICSFESLIGFMAFKLGLVKSIETCSIGGDFFSWQDRLPTAPSNQMYWPLDKILLETPPAPLWKTLAKRIWDTRPEK